jgi:chemotaxis protein CheX
MNVEYINPIIKSIREVLGNWVSENAIVVGKPSLKSSPQEFNDFLVNIGITGDLKGQAILGFKKSTALDLAGKMMMTELSEVDEIAKSAIGELGNMVMGRTSIELANKDITIDITTPVIMEGNVNMSSKIQFLCIPFSINNNNLETFLVLE